MTCFDFERRDIDHAVAVFVVFEHQIAQFERAIDRIAAQVAAGLIHVLRRVSDLVQGIQCGLHIRPACHRRRQLRQRSKRTGGQDTHGDNRADGIFAREHHEGSRHNCRNIGRLLDALAPEGEGRGQFALF